MDRAVTYLTNNQQHMKYDKALANGWPIATGMIEGACSSSSKTDSGSRARMVPRRRRGHPQLRAVVVNGDLGDYMYYY